MEAESRIGVNLRVASIAPDPLGARTPKNTRYLYLQWVATNLNARHFYAKSLQFGLLNLLRVTDRVLFTPLFTFQVWGHLISEVRHTAPPSLYTLSFHTFLLPEL